MGERKNIGEGTMYQSTLHIITPSSKKTPDSILESGTIAEHDLITDLGRFPPRSYEIKCDYKCTDVTDNLCPVTDCWTEARNWLIQFTEQTALQNVLTVNGYGFWWSLNSLRFEPGTSEVGNVFIWIEILETVSRELQPGRTVIYGKHDVIKLIVSQVFQGSIIEIIPESSDRPSMENRPKFPPVLGVIRLLIGIAYLVFGIIWRPEICFFSSTNLLRTRTMGDRQTLRDEYLGDVAEKLKKRHWRIAFVEYLGIKPLWRGLLARRFFFPADLLFILSGPRVSKFIGRAGTVRKWQAKWAEVQSSVAKYAFYRGYNLAPFLVPLVKQVFEHRAPRIETLYELWRRIFKWWRPKLLYINNSYGPLALPAIIAAKSLGILTIEQQHGIIGKNHSAYLIPNSIRLRSQIPLCDFMILWGNHPKHLLVAEGVYDPDSLEICGFPRLDALMRGLPPREETLALLRIPSTAPVVLYCSSPLLKEFSFEIFRNVQEIGYSQLYWIIKLHPREKTRHLWEQVVKQNCLENIRIVEDEVDFYALLATCDIHVASVSTTMIEAAVFRKPNLGIDLRYISDPVGYLEAKAYLPVTPSELGKTAYTILQDKSLRDKLLKEQEEFAKDWCLHDGNAVRRIVNFVEAKIRTKAIQS